MERSAWVESLARGGRPEGPAPLLAPAGRQEFLRNKPFAKGHLYLRRSGSREGASMRWIPIALFGCFWVVGCDRTDAGGDQLSVAAFTSAREVYGQSVLPGFQK